MEIPGCNLVLSDHPSGKKRAGFCINYKSYLPLRMIDINYSNDCVRFELMVGNKLFNVIALYIYVIALCIYVIAKSIARFA